MPLTLNKQNLDISGLWGGKYPPHFLNNGEEIFSLVLRQAQDKAEASPAFGGTQDKAEKESFLKK